MAFTKAPLRNFEPRSKNHSIVREWPDARLRRLLQRPPKIERRFQQLPIILCVLLSHSSKCLFSVAFSRKPLGDPPANFTPKYLSQAVALSLPLAVADPRGEVPSANNCSRCERRAASTSLKRSRTNRARTPAIPLFRSRRRVSYQCRERTIVRDVTVCGFDATLR